MKKIVSDPQLVAHCGLYCGGCRRYLNEKCPGCQDHPKAAWCKLRTCCQENHYASCAECATHADPMTCAKFNTWISKVFAIIFRSNRAACIAQIRSIGLTGHADAMARLQKHSLPR